MPANYSEVFHMYEAKCSFCGYEESGIFVPSTSGMPVSKPVTAQIIIGEALPNSHNLMWLRKLHPRFANLSPSELKEVINDACPQCVSKLQHSHRQKRKD
jgi:hypothetical protein